MAGRVSQKVIEVAYTPTPVVRVSQAVVEAIYKPTTVTVRVSQKVVEAAYQEEQPKMGMQILWVD